MNNAAAALKKIVALTLVASIIGVLPGPQAYKVYADAPVGVDVAVGNVNAGAVPLAGTQVQAMTGSAAATVYVGGSAAGNVTRLPGLNNVGVIQEGGSALGSESQATGQGLDSVIGADAQGTLSSSMDEQTNAARENSGSAVTRHTHAVAPVHASSDLSETEAAGSAEKDFYQKIGQPFRTVSNDDAPVRASQAMAAAAVADVTPAASVNGVLPQGADDRVTPAQDKSTINIPTPSAVSRPSLAVSPAHVGAVALAVLAPVAALAMGVSAPAVAAGALAWFAVVLPSAIVHEVAHGLVATALGDPTARDAGRLTLNPVKHSDLKLTVLLPMAMILMGLPPIGAAKPVPVDPSNFKHPNAGLAAVALAGPMANVGMALAAAGLFHAFAASAAPFAAPAAMALFMGVRLNLMLGLFNLLPVPGMDGANILRGLFPPLRPMIDAGEALLARSRLAKFGLFTGLMLIALPHLAVMSAAATGLLLGLTAAAPAPMAAAPAVIALGLSLFGAKQAPRDASREFIVPTQMRLSSYFPASASSERSRLIVQAPAGVSWKRDYHVDWVDWKQPNAMNMFRDEVGGMYGQMALAGISAEALDAVGARPIANYHLIGAATLEVPSDKRAQLEAELKAKGFSVYENKIIRMVRPAPVVEKEGFFTKAVTLKQVTEITGADKVQEILKAELAGGVDPTLLNIPGFLKPLTIKALRWAGVVKTPVSPAGSIIDTGNDPDHPMLKGHYSIDAKDQEGHGTWVGSAVTSFDPWQKNLRSYNTFGDGSASTDDILRDMAKADADGAEWFTNSWGDDAGDPNSPDSQLVRKIAEKGKVFFFAAGNAGSGDNTVGGPAIAYTRDAKTGTDMIVSVGATDGEGKTASFQSRGPWSPTVSEHPDQYKDYPNRVDIQSVGHKVYGAYPTYMSGADKQDPALGPQKEESGTSMSTPTMGGAYSLLREFGFDPVSVVKALMDGAKKTGKPAAEGGRGFLDVHAAYLQLKQAQDSKPAAKLRNLVRPVAAKIAAKFMAPAATKAVAADQGGPGDWKFPPTQEGAEGAAKLLKMQLQQEANVDADVQAVQGTRGWGVSVRFSSKADYEKVKVLFGKDEQAQDTYLGLPVDVSFPNGIGGTAQMLALAVLTGMGLLMSNPAYAATTSAAGHPAMKVGLSAIAGAAIGFVVGAGVGIRVTRDSGGGDAGALIGFVLLMRGLAIGIVALGGAAIGAVAGAVFGATR